MRTPTKEEVIREAEEAHQKYRQIESLLEAA
jgi:hypothetical protein